MPQRIIPSENARQPKGCLIASAIFFIGLVALFIYAAVQVAMK